MQKAQEGAVQQVRCGSPFLEKFGVNEVSDVKADAERALRDSFYFRKYSKNLYITSFASSLGSCSSRFVIATLFS